MGRRVVAVDEQTHRQLKLLSARVGKTMEELVKRALLELLSTYTDNEDTDDRDQMGQ